VWRPRNALCEEATGSIVCLVRIRMLLVNWLLSISCGCGKSFVVWSRSTDRRRVVATDMADQGTQLSTGNAWRQAYGIVKHVRACRSESFMVYPTKRAPKLLTIITSTDIFSVAACRTELATTCTMFGQGLRYSRLYAREHHLFG
jgi:hypothetical protein